MSDVPIEVIVAAFQSEDGAKEALKELKRARNEGLIKINDAAVIRKDAKGKLHIKETADMSTGKGAGIGAVIGGVVGLLAGPIGIGLGAAAGAAIGGVAAHGDAGIKDERLETIGAGLQPETSAIVAIVEHMWVAAVQAQLAEEASDVMAQQLSADIHEQLSSGKEVAYSAIAAEGMASMSRTAGDENEIEQSSITVTDDTVEITEAVINKEGAAILDAVVTEDEALIAAAVITPDDEDGEEAEDAVEDVAQVESGEANVEPSDGADTEAEDEDAAG